MPVERFTEEDGEEEAPTDQVATAEDPNTRRKRSWLAKFLFAAGGTVGLTGILLACFLLTGVMGRSGTGVSAHDGMLVQLEEQTINLAEPGARLDVRIVFEASSPEFAVLLRRHTAQLADITIAVMSTKTRGQLDSELERNRLKRELADAVGQNVRSNEAYITNVYFTQFYYE